MTNVPESDNLPAMDAIDRLSGFRALMELLEISEREIRRTAARSKRSRSRTGLGEVLHPGPDTPLWLALAREVESQLTRRGEKVNLARELGISRQRLHVLIKARTALPDAERTLMLVSWLLKRRAGRGELVAGKPRPPRRR